MAGTKTGVYPVFENKFKIGKSGRSSEEADMVTIKDLETFSVSIDGNIEEWKPMEAEGWTRRMVTGKALTITLSGKRNVGTLATTMWPTVHGAPGPVVIPSSSGSFRVGQS